MKCNAIGVISANYTNEQFGRLTEKRPIASLPFGGRYRLIDFPLSNMTNSGMTTVGIITPNYYRSILDHVGVGKPWGLARNTGGLYLLPGTVYGTRERGARFLLKDMMRNKAYFERAKEDFVVFMDASKVMNFEMKPFIKAHEESGHDVTLLYVKTDNHKGAHYLTMDENTGEVTKITGEKEYTENRFLDAMIMSREFLMSLIEWYGARSNMDLLDIISLNIERFDVGSYEFKGYVGIISDVTDFMKVNMELLNSDIRKELFGNEERIICTKVNDAPPALYEPGAKVKNSLVASGCIIEGTVENSIIYRSTHIKPGAVVKNSVVMLHTVIGENAYIDNLICDKYVTVSDGVHISGGMQRPLIAGKGEML